MKQQNAVESWWFQADEVTRARALQLTEIDLLPEDMALDLVLAGIRIDQVLTRAGIGHVIPQALWDFLEAVRELRSGA
ncbi:hypothetical protein [Kineococcus sp. SYSU DK003]|uniref:hypothetical protein n=1 Tax=Kineococcus sp. SYSU DK003 TaxID=3383124 RepID=UPI003D7D0FD9